MMYNTDIHIDIKMDRYIEIHGIWCCITCIICIMGIPAKDVQMWLIVKR